MEARLLLSIVSLVALGLSPGSAGAIVQPVSAPASAAQPAPAAAQEPTPAAAQEPGPAPLLPAQRARFSIFGRGLPIGSEELSVERTAGGWLLSGTGRLEAPINLTWAQADVRYGPDLRPRELRLFGQFQDEEIDLTTAFDGTTARSRFLQDGETRETVVDVPVDAVVLPNNFFGAYAVLGARLARSRPGAEIPIFVAPQAMVVAVLDEVLEERVQTASRSFAVRRHRMTFRNPGGPFSAEVETEEDGTLVRVVLPAPQLQVVREDVASVAARHLRFVREGDEDVRIPGNGFSLAATVSKPRTLPDPPRGRRVARLPAVVLVPGSGPVDRDGIVAGVPILGELAAGLADAGYFVVRYDKRGVGQSGGREEAATLSDYAEDVRSIIRWLRDRDDVDDRNLTVVGHSEGAWVALLAASRERRITRAALLAAAGTTGAELVLEQQAAALDRMGLSEEERRQRIELQQKIHVALLKGGSWEGVPSDLRRQADTPWFASLLAFDPAEAMPRVRQPVLIVTGELDRQVPVYHAEKLAALARARTGDRGVSLVTVPGVNHLLARAKTGEVEEYPVLDERHIAAAVVTAISEWMAGRTPSAGAVADPLAAGAPAR